MGVFGNGYKHSREVLVELELNRDGYHDISRKVVEAVVEAVPDYYSSETIAKIIEKEIIHKYRGRGQGGG